MHDRRHGRRQSTSLLATGAVNLNAERRQAFLLCGAVRERLNYIRHAWMRLRNDWLERDLEAIALIFMTETAFIELRTEQVLRQMAFGAAERAPRGRQSIAFGVHFDRAYVGRRRCCPKLYLGNDRGGTASRYRPT